MILFWADTRRPLTHEERQRVRGLVELVDLTPAEVLVLVPGTGRKIVVRAEGDPHAPPRPLERDA
jgi:hypothetical protein